MEFRSYVTLLLLAFGFLAKAQVIMGKTLQKENRSPLPFTTVYLEQTDIGTTSDKYGDFSLRVLVPGKYRLRATYVGRNDYTRSIVIGLRDTLRLEVLLSEGSRILDEVEIVGEEPNREKLMKSFSYYLIGNSKYARRSEIENKQDLYFFDSKESFQARAIDPVVISNPALGYKIHYQLVEFYVDKVAGRLYMKGVPRFFPMSEKVRKKVARNREKAFMGSLRHFFRSLITSEDPELFEVRPIYRIYQQDRPSDQEIAKGLIKFKAMIDTTSGDRSTLQDSLSYFRLEAARPAYRDSLGSVLSRDDIYRNKGDTLLLKGGNYQVRYLGEPLPGYSTEDEAVLSKLMISSGALRIYSNGAAENIDDMYVEGYWFWAERLANALPLNYRLPR